MKQIWKIGLVALVLIFWSSQSPGQGDEDMLDALLDNLKINFLSPLQSEGVSVSNEQRTKFIGYILDRQSRYMGEFEADKLRMQKLTKQVKDFLNQLSPEEDLWPLVEVGMTESFKTEVHSLLGGSPYVRPIFNSIGDVYRDRSTLDFTESRYYNYPDKNKIIASVQGFLMAIRDKRFDETPGLVAGHFAEEWSKILEDLKTDPEQRQAMEALVESMEWKLFSAKMADSQPPLVHIIWGIAETGGNWADYEIYLILDAGTWRIIKLEKE